MALALTRRAGQSIIIGPDIRVFVSYIRGDIVSIAVEAPKELDIIRDEICPPSILERFPKHGKKKKPAKKASDSKTDIPATTETEAD